MKLNPLTQKKLKRFYSLKRGYYSFLIFAVLLGLSLIGELLINNKALIVSYNGTLYFPTYTAQKPGTHFGESYSYEADYRNLKEKFKTENTGNWVLMPIVPYNPLENDFREDEKSARPPSLKQQHFLGTDTTGRDILARLFYGFRTAMIFALGFMAFVYLAGITIGCAMGYWGGTFDLIVQRLIEIWSNIPFLFVVIIIASIIRPNLSILLFITAVFSWTSITYYMRTGTYREKERDYIAAAQVLGASTPRIIFHHILPNILSTLVTFMPFTIAAAITSLTALDFLGFGLPVPSPSWGELLRQGTGNLYAPWIVMSAFCAMVSVLILITFIGEAIREAFDPKKFTTYQ